MIEVRLNRGRFKLDPEKGLKILKKKLLKEGVLKELRERQYFVSEGRRSYIERNHRKYLNEKARNS